MANVRAFRSGNWSDTNTTTSPWATGGVVYAPAAGDDVYSNNFTITIDTSPTVTSVTNAAATSRLWKDGATTTATAGGGFTLKAGQTLTATVNTGSNATVLTFSESGNTSIVGDINASATNAVVYGIQNSSNGSVFVTGNAAGNAGVNSAAIFNSSSGIVNITGNVTGSASTAIRNNSSGSIIVTGNVEAGAGSSSFGHGIFNSSTGSIEIVGNVTATPSLPAVSSTNVNSVVKCSGSFFYAINGQIPIACNRIILNATPLAAKTRYALNGSSTFVDMFTADNSLGQANPTDVRNGVSYASGTLTGKMLIPARGAIASGVAYGPTMPFTATRSGTTATATLTYSYPYQVGDIITVSDASNPEWNMDYTIASVVSGDSVTFEVPSTHSSTAGTGANMQTKGTSTLDVSAVAAAVWGAATSSLTTAGSIGERLKNSATVATTGEQLATALTAP